MKKKLIAIILFSFFTVISAHSLVFVHIGDQLPVYLQDCIAQARLFNPMCTMYLIANEKAYLSCTTQFAPYNITYVPIESLHKTDRHQQFLRKTSYEPGFWRYASERFLYIDDFMQQHHLSDVFHIENDVMLYVDLAVLEPKIQEKYDGIAAVFDSDNRCIPSFMYIPDAKYMAHMAHYFVAHTSKHKNDMEIIALFKNATSETVIDHLPIIMPAYINAYGLKNQLGHRPKNPYKYSNNIELFNSIFDAAALGQYLGGTFFADKGPGFVNETSVFDSSKLNYVWIADEQNRKIPYAIFNGVYYRINNLHIHSKQLNKFSSK